MSLIPPHGGYRQLASYQSATIVYDLTVEFCRKFVDQSYRSNMSYTSYLADPESAANLLITLIHQTNFLLDRQIKALEQDFLEQGGFTERL